MRVTSKGKTQVPFLESAPNRYHVTAAMMKKEFKRFGWKWDDYYKFTFVRNPWDLCISFYHHSHRKDERIGKPVNKTHFQKWIKHVYTYYSEDSSQASYYCDHDNNVIVDHIAQYEFLQQEMQTIRQQLNIPQEPLTNPEGSATVATIYDRDQYYNDNAKQYVEHHDADVINRFGYTYVQ